MRKAYLEDLQDNRLWMSQAFFNEQDTKAKRRQLKREGSIKISDRIGLNIVWSFFVNYDVILFL